MGLLRETIFGRLLDQFKDGANWNLFLDVIADDAEELIDTSVDISTRSWKDTAEGWWLDRVGEIVGILRPPEEITDNIFTVTEYGDTTHDTLRGWGEVGEAIGGYVWDILGISTGVPASDSTYRDFIDAKIFATCADASIPGIARWIYNAFGLTTTVTRTGTRQVTITLPATGFDLRKFRYMKLLCPAVAGVEVVFSGWPEV